MQSIRPSLLKQGHFAHATIDAMSRHNISGACEIVYITGAKLDGLTAPAMAAPFSAKKAPARTQLLGLCRIQSWSKF